MRKEFYSTNRFSNRVENYVKYRPHYPDEVLEFLVSELALKQDSVIADIGSGTGISSELFVKNGNAVYGVEPNKKMRKAAEEAFKKCQNFISIDGTAEHTTLNSRSIDLIIAGQSFHWFDLRKSKKEFERILRPHGIVTLIWNERKSESSEFMGDYETLLNTYGIDYKEVKQKNVNEKVLGEFFEKNKYKTRLFSNCQEFDFAGLRGRLLSSSYAPTKGHPNYDPMIDSLQDIFKKHQQNGEVRFDYDTRLYSGRLE